MIVKNRYKLLSLNRHIGWFSTGQVVVLLCLLLVVGCATSPSQIESLDYQARAETQVDGRVRVSAVVLSPQEAENSFSVPLAKKGIQPIWLEVNNQEDKEFFLMLLTGRLVARAVLAL